MPGSLSIASGCLDSAQQFPWLGAKDVGHLGYLRSSGPVSLAFPHDF